MKSFYLLLFFVCFCISNSYGQAYSDYNRKGDLEIAKNDYYGARMWYAEGLENCDLYSIRQLTSIWTNQPGMRRTMNSIISRCHTCLKTLSDAKDLDTKTNSMRLLAEYYKQGIGVDADPEYAENLAGEVARILGFSVGAGTESPENVQDSTSTAQQNNSNNDVNIVTQTRQLNFAQRYKLFLSYTYSPTMPVGFSVGGFDQWGVIFTYKTSVDSRNYIYECNNEGIINIEKDTPYTFENGDDKWRSWMVTGGVMLPVLSKKIFVSAGGGYGLRDYYCQAYLIDSQKRIWCYNSQASYKGIAFEVGCIYKHKNIIFSGGVNSIQFRDIDAYISMGLTF